ncbi:MAG: FG-GAP-like repeat-containing protein [Chthoniobacterales bacterium]
MIRSLISLSRSLGLLAAVGWLATTANAYVLNGKVWPNGSTVVFQMSLGQAPRTLIDGNTSWNAAAAPALDIWNQNVAQIQVSKVMDSTAPVASGDHVNSVAFASSVFGQSFGTGTLAVTYYISQGNNLTEADVLFNVAQTFDSYRGPLRFGGAGGYATGDVRRVLLHELGHALGLNHSSGDNVMAPVTSDREVLSGDDLAAIHSLYGTPASTPPPTPTPTPGSGVKNDFNGDRKPDLVWQNNVTGERGIWLMNGSSMTAAVFLPSVPIDWRIVSTADFNGDGQMDLLWQNKVTGECGIWYMNGTSLVSIQFLPTVPVAWQIAATGDFNGDGHPDIVWQNTVTGQRVIWLMNGGTLIVDRSLPTVPVEWSIVGASDFNGDGQVDLVWEDNVTGQRGIWLMNGTTAIELRFLPTVALEWKIAGTGDYNGDGQTDLIWQNTITGQRAFWFMNGSTMIGSAFLPTIPTAWEIRTH